MPQAMQPDWAQAIRRDDAMERPCEIPRFDWATGTRGKDQIVDGPLVRRSTEDLQLGVLKQHAARHPEQRQITAASTGLDRTKLKSASGPQQLLANADNTVLQVHILPAESEHLAAPQAVDEQQDKRRIQPITARGFQKGARLTGRPRLLPDRTISGSVASRATLRETSSSRMARVSADPRTVRMT